jgi:hypothetical protein
MADLTITFAGLCLLVQDRAAGAMHVLMPTIRNGHIHHPVLAFHDKDGKPQKEDIGGLHLELQDVAGSNGFDAAVPLDVFDFGDSLLEKRNVRRDLLDKSTPLPDEVRTRVRLTTGRHNKSSRPGGIWNFEVQNTHVPRRMPTAVEWLIRGVASPVVLADTRKGKSFQLFPSADGSIRALIAYLTPGELARLRDVELPGPDGCPKPGHPAMHFELFFQLLTPSDVPSVPKFDLSLSQAAGVCPPTSSTSAATPERSAAVAAAAVAAAAGAVAAAAAALNPTASGSVSAAASATAAAAQAVAAISSAGPHEPPTDTVAALGECGGHGHGRHAAAAAAGAGSDLTCMVTTGTPP